MMLRHGSLGWDLRLGLAIDRALSVLAPTWAKRRVMDRAHFQLMHRAVSAGAPDRTNAVRQPSRQGPINKTRKDLVATRAQARELFQRNPYARGVINSCVANLIGCGIRPQARVLKPKKGDPDEAFNDVAEEEWKFWVDTSGPSGRENYYEQQRQMQRELFVAGETILVLSTPTDSRRIPLAVEVVPSERLAADLDREPKDGNRIVQGVEINAIGHPVAYWIYKNHPGDSIRLADKPQRVPADRVLHIFEELEPGQVRGMTRLLTCAGAFEALMQLMDFQLTRARIASAFALMITDDGTGVRLVKTGDTEDDEDADGNEIGHLEGGMILRGKPGEGLTSAGPAIQDTQLEAFITVILRMIGRGLDVAYEVVSRDYSKVTYLSARAGENQDRRHEEPQQAFLNRRANCPVWRDFVKAAGSAGRLKVGDPIERFCAVEFMPQERPWIDPVKDAQADLIAVQAGLASPIEAINKRGKDPFKILQDIEQFKRWAEDFGLELTIFGGNKSAPSEPQKEEEEENDAEQQEGKKAKAA